MAIKIKTQRDYLLTEVNMELPSDLNELDYLMRSSHGTGKIVAVYNEGALQGVNLEQKTKVREGVSAEVRDLIGVRTKEINGHSRR